MRHQLTWWVAILATSLTGCQTMTDCFQRFEAYKMHALCGHHGAPAAAPLYAQPVVYAAPAPVQQCAPVAAAPICQPINCGCENVCASNNCCVTSCDSGCNSGCNTSGQIIHDGNVIRDTPTMAPGYSTPANVQPGPGSIAPGIR